MDKKKKKDGGAASWLIMLALIAAGGVCGWFAAVYADSVFADGSIGELLLLLGGIFLCIYAASYVQAAIHEAGHWLFGALTGYQLVSYRLGSLMWLREDGKIRLKRFSLAGTGGQCLMAPPDWQDGKFPFLWYNLGGSIMNFAAAAVFALLAWAVGMESLAGLALLLFALIGVGLGLTNIIPLRLPQMDNDGRNALVMARSQDARWGFWVMMKINEQNARGTRVKDMPAAWFDLRPGAEMDSGLASSVAVFACSRALDELKIDEAAKMNTRLLAEDIPLAGVYRRLLTCDAIFCELVRENRAEAIDGLLTKEQRQFMKAMKNYPSVLRTEYALALLYDRDPAKAEAVLARLEKVARAYPYAAELAGERELMALAKDKAA